jgi:hypothetical protein
MLIVLCAMTVMILSGMSGGVLLSMFTCDAEGAGVFS